MAELAEQEKEITLATQFNEVEQVILKRRSVRIFKKLYAIQALLLALFLAIPAYANIYPPKPAAHFYGDANGDTGITGADIVQHQNFILSKPYTYDTLQPNNSAQSWNTCDVDSNQGCTGADTVILNSYLLSKSVSILDDPWSVNNLNLPLTGNTPATWIPFNIDLHSTYGAAASGRPGISVTAEIVGGTTTGSLAGRTCSPGAGSRDQVASADSQCALSVTQTNWGLDTGQGLTESGTYGFSVKADSGGDLRLLFSISAQPALDVPSTTLGVTVSFVSNWTWISGSDGINQNGVYGTKGVAATTNIPGSRVNATTFKDLSGNLMLFGGWGYTTSGGGWLNDIWRWDGTYWTWVSGSNVINLNGVYGSKGVPDSANMPGSRDRTVSWVDSAGNFWLFGGFGYAVTGTASYLNDLWRWDGTNWTWMSGGAGYDYNGVYGTKGVPDSANVPGSRYHAVSWTDIFGNFWLFGGNGYPASGSWGRLNDLWRWDGSNWTWMSGSDATLQYGIYGSKGVPNSANCPGSRYYSFSWTDTSGNFWLFGGSGYSASSLGRLNDLWRWDGANWTWISGSNDINQYGVYGTKDVPNPANCPGSRNGSTSWTDASGNFWLFGGQGYAASGALGTLNDLWRWDGSNWTWISGSNVIDQNGVYGTKGEPAITNIPGSRTSAATWTDLSGNLWFFGGYGFPLIGGVGYLNDLWMYDL